MTSRRSSIREIWGDLATEVTITFPGDFAGGGGTISNTCGGGGGSNEGGRSSSSSSSSGGGGGNSGGGDSSSGGGGGTISSRSGGEVAAAEEDIAAAAQVPDVAMNRDGADDAEGGEAVEEHLVQQFITEELDPVVAGITSGVARGLGMLDSEMGTHFDFDMSTGLPPSCGGAASTDRAPSRGEAESEKGTQTPRDRTTSESPDATRDIMERERARLMASNDPRAQAFVRALEERRRRERGRDVGQGGAVVGEDAMKVVAAKAEEGMEGGP
ncbi:hypothetical protein CBR_g49474 [Chara braunii]|uniref:Uncharacterized protein n=1 Tax=Chara braunii TaxID=69332 RepID=A0A388K4Z4_CHABU|nr:hypothetical protein CBR_g49474 [Chara braunii]|eukprot:GBG65111.1 hypothetical protein CBR_g49474 [Chara braunii]